MARCAFKEILAGKHEFTTLKDFLWRYSNLMGILSLLVFLSNCNESEKHQMTHIFL